MFRVVACDLDGTLLRDDRTISDRTRRVLDRVRAGGVEVVPVTARQPATLAPIARECGFSSWAVCLNGALVTHLASGEIAARHYLPEKGVGELVAATAAARPDLRFAGITGEGESIAEAGYLALVRRPPSVSVRVVGREELIRQPLLKVMFRAEGVDPAALLAEAMGWVLPGVELTQSGAPWVEATAAGVTKATGLAVACRLLDAQPAEVVAFGDADNDIPMLAWAGRSWAMRDASPQVQAVATDVAPSNNDDGVATVLASLVSRDG